MKTIIDYVSTVLVALAPTTLFVAVGLETVELFNRFGNMLTIGHA